MRHWSTSVDHEEKAKPELPAGAAEKTLDFIDLFFVVSAFSLDTAYASYYYCFVSTRNQERQEAMENDNWYPANGGTETPFVARTGRRLLYVFQPLTGSHAYLDLDTDLILSNDEALSALAIF